MLPHPSVLNVLEPAYNPCPGFARTCKSMRWAPSAGHVPRGFVGAYGSTEGVRLVLVTAEPGNPYIDEQYPTSGTPRQILEVTCRNAYQIIVSSIDPYHQNLRYILNGCFPNMSLREQLKHVWKTDSVLCSAKNEGRYVRAAIESECRTRYLEAQLRLFPNAVIAALGTKAIRRLRGWPNVLSAISIAPQGCNLPRARPSWDDIIRHVLNLLDTHPV